MYTLLYLKWITKKHVWYSIGNSAQGCVAAWWEGSLGENIYVAESLCCPPETIIALLIGYIPLQNKKVFFKLKKKSTTLMGENYNLSSKNSPTPCLLPPPPLKGSCDKSTLTCPPEFTSLQYLPLNKTASSPLSNALM